MTATFSYSRHLSAAAVLVGALLLSACGGVAPTAVPPATATTPAMAAATPAATTGTAPTDTAAAGTTPAMTAASGGPVGAGTLSGAGSTFINPLMSKWTKEYNTLHSDVKINYQSIGSGGGRQQFIAKTVDFGASDAPMTDAQIQQAGGADAVLHIPMTMGAVVIGYNLPGATTLKFSADSIAGIFLGTITNWNDPKIAADNTGATLPDQPIVVVHRSEGSGTTDIFTDYLSKVSPDWKSKVGRGTSVQWPVGIGGQGNEGVANAIKNSVGGIGYIELAYATQNKIAYGMVKNQSGNYIQPSPETTTNAAAGLAGSVPADLRYSITNAADPQAYPIAGTTWVLVYKNQTNSAKGKLLAGFLSWAVHDGQKYGAGLDYATLPSGLVQKVDDKLKSMSCGGSPCLGQ